MAAVLDKITMCIDNKIEAEFRNDVERVYNEKIHQSGGFKNTTRDQRQLMWEEACDSVADKRVWKVIRFIW